MTGQTISSAGGFSNPARWGIIILAAGLLIAYPVLSAVLIGNQRETLISTSLAMQSQAAHAVRNSISTVGFQTANISRQLAEAAQVANSSTGGSSLSFAIIARDGQIMAESTGSMLAGSTNLGNYKLLRHPGWAEWPLIDAMQADINCSGELLLPSSAKPGILIATDYSPTESWQVIAMMKMDGITQACHTTRLYLLLTFLSLSLLLVVLIVSFYLSLAAGLSSAINSAAALEQASIRFQESMGEFRRPLHNIQGLADMLAITEDPDERIGYLKEIKREVNRLNEGLKTSEPS